MKTRHLCAGGRAHPVRRWGLPGSGLLIAACLTGCASVPVQPWEKGLLALPGMTFESDRLDAAYVEHTYASKEGAAGGAAVGGGGCGCN